MALGVAVVYLLNHLIDRKTRKEVSHTADAHHPETHDDIDELVHADHLNMHKRHNDSKLSLFVAGIVMACAIALHNVPEGMTIGASFAVSDNLHVGHGHDHGRAHRPAQHPRGHGRGRAAHLRRHRARACNVSVTAACGLPTRAGRVAGLLAGRHRAAGAARCRSGSPRGAMLYVVFGEILPAGRCLMYRSKLPAFAVMVGLALGMFMIFF